MNYTEKLDWILDKKGKHLNSDEEYKQNIDFVHSLGLKCDCVGWSKLDFNDPNVDELLDKIKTFCKTKGWSSRCCYTRNFTDVKSDWFELKHVGFKDNTTADLIETTAEDGSKISFWSIRAYHETSTNPKRFGGDFYVSERFRNACIKNQIKGIDFCWVPDKGKYESAQYFIPYIQQKIPRIFCCKQLKKTDFIKISLLGGNLPKIAKQFDELQFTFFQDCFLAEDMPESGIAYAYNEEGNFSHILIHKDTAELLIQQKALSPDSLTPAPIFDKKPGGYSAIVTQNMPRPKQEFIDEMLLGYEKLKSTPRPVRQVSEKEALKALRKAKSNRKEDFGKRMPKQQNEALADTEYSALAPYYLVANGGYLSDEGEYEFLSYDAAIEANNEFKENLAKEELLEQKPDGVVFANCADGDVVLYLKDGSVIRFSHEEPEAICQWKSLAQFFFDAITEDE